MHPFTIATFRAFPTSGKCVSEIYRKGPRRCDCPIHLYCIFQATTERSSVMGRTVCSVTWKTRAVRGTRTASTTTAVSRAVPGGWSVTRDGWWAPSSPTSTKTEAPGEESRWGGGGRGIASCLFMCLYK